MRKPFFKHRAGWISLIAVVLVLAVGAQLLAARLLHVDIGFWQILWPSTLISFGIGDGVTDVDKFIGLEVILFQQVLQLERFIVFLRRTVLDEFKIRVEFEEIQRNLAGGF